MQICLNVREGGVFLWWGAYLVTVVAGGGGGGGGGRGADLFPGSSSLSPSFTLSCSSLTLGRNTLKIGPKAFKTGICLFLNALFMWFLPFCELFAPNQKNRFNRVRPQQMKSLSFPYTFMCHHCISQSEFAGFWIPF